MPAIKNAVATDPFIKAWYQQQLAVGEKLLATPPDVYVIDGDEHTRLSTAREMEGRSAALTRNGATIHARILAPADARFSTVSTQPTAPQEPNQSLTNLVIPIHQQSSAATIAVLFTGSGDKKTPHIKPLAEWK